MRADVLAKILGWAGLLPFIAGAAIGEEFLLLSYGVIIAAFLSGIHWQQGLAAKNNPQIALSMIPAIAGIAVLMLAILKGVFVIALCAAAALLWFCLWMDIRFLKQQPWMFDGYARFRTALTIIASLCLFSPVLIGNIF